MASTTTAIQQPPPCHLLKLPPELRLEIYSHLFGAARRVHLDILDGISLDVVKSGILLGDRPGIKNGEWHGIDGVALLRTCKKIYEESRPTLYKHTVFSANVKGGNLSNLYDNDAIDLGEITSESIRRFFRHVEVLNVTIFLHNWYSALDRLILRIDAFLNAIEFGRNLKTLKIGFSLVDGDDEESGAKAICSTLERIECGGQVVLSYRGPLIDRLTNLAMKIGGKVV